MQPVDGSDGELASGDRLPVVHLAEVHTGSQRPIALGNLPRGGTAVDRDVHHFRHRRSVQRMVVVGVGHHHGIEAVHA